MKVRELLSNATRWTKGTYAKNHLGNNVLYTDEKACQWCLSGAIQKCYPNNYGTITKKVEAQIGSDILNWNDKPQRFFQEVQSLVEVLDI